MTNGNPVMHNSDVVSLQAFFERILVEIDKRYEQRFEAQETANKSALASAQMAVDKSERNTKAWQDNSNEWRAAMNDKDKMFATKSEVLGRLEKIDGALGELKTVRDIAIGKASQNSVIGAYAIAIIGILITLIRTFLK